MFAYSIINCNKKSICRTLNLQWISFYVQLYLKMYKGNKKQKRLSTVKLTISPSIKLVMGSNLAGKLSYLAFPATGLHCSINIIKLSSLSVQLCQF